MESVIAVLEVLVWPSAALAGLLILRQPISGLLNGFKNRSVKYGDAQIGAEQQAQTALSEPTPTPTPALPSAAEPALPVPAKPATFLFEAEDNPYIAEMAALVRQNVTSKTFASHEERDRWMYREGAKLEIRVEFERLYRALFHSQFLVLIMANNALNAGGVTQDVVANGYNEAAKRFPEYYKTYPFDSWLRYVTSNSLLVQNGTQWVITNKGQLYLHFLTATGYGTRANERAVLRRGVLVLVNYRVRQLVQIMHGLEGCSLFVLRFSRRIQKTRDRFDGLGANGKKRWSSVLRFPLSGFPVFPPFPSEGTRIGAGWVDLGLTDTQITSQSRGFEDLSSPGVTEAEFFQKPTPGTDGSRR